MEPPMFEVQNNNYDYGIMPYVPQISQESASGRKNEISSILKPST